MVCGVLGAVEKSFEGLETAVMAVVGCNDYELLAMYLSLCTAVLVQCST
eukprot:COSAG05_NODE_4326_length_1566_cov_2.548739_1_plen_49_part_00